MQFPIFYPAHIGNGTAIGAEAITHVVVSHGFAIGVLTMIALAEYLGFRRGIPAWEDFAKRVLGYAVIITTGVGAVTGVGIWFLTSAFVPRAIGSMLRIFFWPWFIEWLVFAAEVVVVLIYYFTWDRWQGQRKLWHIRLGGGYVVLAIASAFLITGILSFMLTSDGWPWDQRFWQAFFNPSFAPHLLMRIGGAFALGGLFSLGFLFVCCRERRFQRDAARLFGLILLAAVAATGMSTWWYFVVVPSAFRSHAVNQLMLNGLPAAHLVFWLMNGSAVVVVLVVGATCWRGKLVASKLLLVPAILLAIGLVGEFEYIREFMRGPYLMPGYMYANTILIDEHGYLSRHGLLANSHWYQALGGARAGKTDRGSYLFAQNCSSCHTQVGISSMSRAMSGRSEDGIYAILGHTHQMVPWMPPFTGTDSERRDLAHYLYQLSKGKVKRTEAGRFPEPEGSG